MPHTVTDDDLWQNVAANLSKVTIKESATEFLSSVTAEEIKTAKAFQATMRGFEAREHQGKPATTFWTRRAYWRFAGQFAAMVKDLTAFRVAWPSATRQ